MEKQPQKIQNYNSDLTTNHISNFNKSKLIWLIVPAIIFIGLIATFYFIFTDDSEDNSETIIAKNEEPQKNIQDIAEMEKCLEMEEFDLNCNLLFSSPDIEEKCEKIENLKDECFYKIAIMNIRLDLCWQIEDDDLKQNCEIEINNIPISIPQDTDRFYPGQYAS